LVNLYKDRFIKKKPYIVNVFKVAFIIKIFSTILTKKKIFFSIQPKEKKFYQYNPQILPDIKKKNRTLHSKQIFYERNIIKTK
tara:strand:+ start:391 stop:639 length:249 start_codon:yes stop_codon:yes gene_type:complete